MYTGIAYTTVIKCILRSSQVIDRRSLPLYADKACQAIESQVPQ